MKKNKKIDLHMHSIYSSDGEFHPCKLLEIAKENNLTAVALTDHNTVAGISEAIAAGKHLGIEVVPGIEIDSQFRKYSIHILGYYFDINDDKLNNLLTELNSLYYGLAQKRVTKLTELGFDIDYQQVLDYAVDLPVGVVIAEALLKNKKNFNHPLLKPYLTGEKSKQPYFNFHLDFFSRGKAAYVHFKSISSKQVIKLIKGLGGIPVLAHPGYSFNYQNENDLTALKELIAEGLVGIEAYSSYHKQNEINEFEQIGKDNSLIITAGSDFHGKLKPEISMGGIKNNNYSILEELKDYLLHI
ncbi:PHP domain-containing protein [Halocella sp. SP3-1]|uniref:PHP domain-containing protein n=1 Tax=Halocella sp. SP3-1 TaxID=2382161 RepID=UPI000F75DEEE|nr:PHP domain-containing protein [Halocella sp. SP3-1]AZO95386.1 PHP domain-containing protein [Halocella sp. SP3-1]